MGAWTDVGGEWLRWVSFTLAVALLGPAVATRAQPAGVQAAWIELSTDGPVVRAITTAAACPRAATGVSSGATPPAWQDVMTVRASPSLPDFPDRVCQWLPPAGTVAVAIEGWPPALRLPASNPRRIVVFGDSGCQGVASGQDCASQWYLPDIARLAAARQPDLVIHLGDYNYRGTACVAYDGCCTYNPINCGSPRCGDDQVNWRADVFTPLAPLLAAAPWVMVRGNHELCSRAGRGYFRYLDPHPTPPVCADNPVRDPTYTDPYAVPLGGALRLLVFDAADACGEQRPEVDQVPAYRAQFARLAELAAAGTAEQTWMVAHKSVWSLLRDLDGAPPVVLNYTLQQASANRLPAPITLLLSGHEHLFQSLTMSTPGFPTALVVGTGGAELDNPQWVPARVANLPTSPGGPTIGVGVTIHDHGYLLIEPASGAWTATFYDRFDQPLATCASNARPSVCVPTL